MCVCVCVCVCINFICVVIFFMVYLINAYINVHALGNLRAVYPKLRVYIHKMQTMSAHA